MSDMSLQGGYKRAVKFAEVLCPAQNSQSNLAATAKAPYPAIICMPNDHILHLWASTTPRGCTACSKRDSSTHAHTLPVKTALDTKLCLISLLSMARHWEDCPHVRLRLLENLCPPYHQPNL